ncbi:outer membrane protein [gamma proteobacterium HTCC5015]|nr:outer membrane protein [gamma proteobacterium HTCC5015]
MKKQIFAVAMLAVTLGAQAHETGYWSNSSGESVRTGTGDCVKTGQWEEAHKGQDCGMRANDSKRRIPTPVSKKPIDMDEVAKRKKAQEKAAAEQKAEEQKKALDSVRSINLSSGAAFSTGSAKLSSKGKESLDDLAMKLKALGNGVKSVQIDGHTDSQGSESLNQRVSEQRAQAVKSYLVEQGVDGSLINTKGYGESQPVADNATAAGRAQNRRVEISVDGDIVEAIKR